MFLCVEIVFPLQSLSSAEHADPYKTFDRFLEMHWSPHGRRTRPILAASLSLVFALPLAAQQYPAEMLSGLHWRDVGPMRAGRTYGVSGNAAQPDTFYMGSVGGGVWKTENAGRTWFPIADDPVTGIPLRLYRSDSRRAI
jgi:hypothetical protein